MKKTRIATIGVTAGLSLALMGWGVVAGAEEVMGIIAPKGAATIAASDQPDAKGTVVIDKVVAPDNAFVVVHQNDGGMPGERLGYAQVDEGTSTKVVVKLDPKVKMTPEVLAAVHIDRGKKGEFEFDMENREHSPDQPYFVDGKEVAVAFKAAEFGVPAGMDEASIEAADQALGDKVVISKAKAPTAAFVVVHKAKADGMPGERVGFAPIPAGENSNVEVKLDKKLDGKTKLLAAIHADRGVAGTLEFDMDDPVASPDQPFFADGMEVATAFTVGPWGVKTDGASIEATDQVGAENSIVINKVTAPADAWIVVHKDAGGAPGERVGLKHIDAGESVDVDVPLDAEMLPERLVIAVHADKGTKDVFDFDMDDKLGSADQPYFVGGSEVATVIKVREFGYQTPEGTAAIKVSNQQVKDAKLVVSLAKAPEPAWVVVHLDNGGMPGERVGLMAIPAGATKNAIVQLDASKMLTDQLFVAVHADRGESRLFEFDMMDKVNSPDQPFFVGPAEVATAVQVQ